MPGVRISGGSFKGLHLGCPAGRGTRPTASKVREAVFSILGGLTIEAKVLDLFAGSGAMGLEALSRGAAEVVMCDKAPYALATLERNAARVPAELRPLISVTRAAWPGGAGLLLPRGPFSLCLLDPPYDRPDLAETFLRRAPGLGLVLPGAVAVWEHAPGTLERWTPKDLEPWSLRRLKRWGLRAVAIFAMEEKG
jgi:16S rRNA (guanine(966)-N(2))-methyltransferase RsmD